MGADRKSKEGSLSTAIKSTWKELLDMVVNPEVLGRLKGSLATLGTSKKLLQCGDFPQVLYQLNDSSSNVVNFSFSVEASDAKANGTAGSFVA